MKNIIQFSFDRAVVVLALLLVVTVYLFRQTGRLKIDVSADSLIPRESRAKNLYEEVCRTFGSDKIVAVYVGDPNLFTAARLGKLKKMADELARLPDVERVSSLFSLSLIKGGGGVIECGPLLDDIPADPAELKMRLDEAVNNPLLRRNIIAEDGTATLLALYLKPPAEGKHPADAALRESRQEQAVYDQVAGILSRYSGNFETVFQTGSPSIHVQMAQFIKKDQVFLLPLTGLVLMALLGLILQNVHAAFIPLVNAVLSTIWTLGLMAMLDLPVNALNYMIPVLMVVLGASQDIRLLTEFRELRAEGHDKRTAVHLAGERTGFPLFLTWFTSFLGFIVNGLSPLPIMEQFSLTAAVGMGARFLATIAVTPAYLRLLYPAGAVEGKQAAQPMLARLLADKISAFVLQILAVRPYLVGLLFSTLALPCLYFASQLALNNDMLSFLKKNSPIVINLQTLNQKMSGTEIIYITLRGDKEQFKKAATLKKLKYLTDALRDKNRFPELDTVTSLDGIISFANKEIMGGGPEHEVIPKTDAAIAQYLLFMDAGDLDPYVVRNFSRVNLVLRTRVNNIQLNRLIRRLDDFLRSEECRDLTQNQWNKKFTYVLTGKTALVAGTVDNIAASQAASLASIIAVLFGIVTVLFLSPKMGLLGLAANLFPAVALFGVMGALGIPLNVGTCMVAAITIGISVDDTVHLMVRYNRKLKTVKNEKLAVAQTLHSEILPILATSLSLACGFLLLGFSSFVPVQMFGFLSSMVMIIGIATEFMLTPVLLIATKVITIWDLLSLPVRTTLREKSRLFHGMSFWQVKKIILLSSLEEYAAGAQVIRDGEMGNEMFVVLEGELEISKNTGQKRIVLARLLTGDIIGEVAIIAETRRTADVFTLTSTKLLKVDWNSLEDLRKFSPYLAARIYLNLARILGQRLVQSSERYTLNPWRKPEE